MLPPILAMMMPHRLTATLAVSHALALFFKMGMVRTSVNSGHRKRIKTMVMISASVLTISMEI